MSRPSGTPAIQSLKIRMNPIVPPASIYLAEGRKREQEEKALDDFRKKVDAYMLIYLLERIRDDLERGRLAEKE